MSGIHETLARGGLSLMIGLPMLGEATPDHAPVTRQLELPAGWVFDVGSGTLPSAEVFKALVQHEQAYTDPTMIEVRFGSGLRSATSPAVPVRTVASLVDQYAPYISPQDAAIIRALAGSMSSSHGDPLRNSIYETY